MEAVTRQARSGELAELKNLWKTVFGDPDALVDAFFRHYGADTATVVPADGAVAAAGYLLPVGSLSGRPCAMIYSVAVLPEHRGRGLGTELTRALIASGHAAGYPAVILRPASSGLFDYYGGRTSLREWFYASERTLAAPVPGGGKLIRLTAAEYARLRGELLRDIPHVETDERALSFQADICGIAGGGLFVTGDACAIIECDDAAVNVKELLARDGTADAAVAAIAGAFPADRYVVRSPVSGADGENAHGFGMLAASNECAELSTSRGDEWFGPAFD